MYNTVTTIKNASMTLNEGDCVLSRVANKCASVNGMGQCIKMKTIVQLHNS